jgi:tetratricopeptide (TPR) repeat protein
MIRTSVKITAIVLALIICAGGLAFAAKAKKAEKPMDVSVMLMKSFDLMNAGKFDKAQKMLDEILKKDPGNPLALNNMAAIMVKQNKFDKADTYLNSALTRAKGYMVQVNRVCQVRGICIAFKPAAGGSGNQELEPLVKMNIDMVKQYMSSEPLAGKGPR